MIINTFIQVIRPRKTWNRKLLHSIISILAFKDQAPLYTIHTLFHSGRDISGSYVRWSGDVRENSGNFLFFSSAFNRAIFSYVSQRILARRGLLRDSTPTSSCISSIPIHPEVSALTDFCPDPPRDSLSQEPCLLPPLKASLSSCSNLSQDDQAALHQTKATW